jgi:hypothetical protein
VKSLGLAIILIIACASAFGGEMSAQQRPLELSFSIVNQRYCTGGAGVDFLHLTLRLRFTNVGNQKLILYKGNNLFFTVWIKPAQDNQAGSRFEMKTTASRFLQMTPEDVDRPSPNRDFVFLSLRESFETFIDVSLPVAREEAKRSRGTINNGEHLLQITASTWYESRKLGEQLRERWQRRGLLWLDPVGSAPIRFNSDKPVAAERCQASDKF